MVVTLRRVKKRDVQEAGREKGVVRGRGVWGVRHVDMSLVWE